MFVHRRDVQIQWGDCDPANIVYYPRYFAMFDDSTSILFEAAGFSKQDIIHKYGLVGIPMVDTRAKFHIASTHGDWITIESRVESFKRSSFEVTHDSTISALRRLNLSGTGMSAKGAPFLSAPGLRSTSAM